MYVEKTNLYSFQFVKCKTIIFSSLNALKKNELMRFLKDLVYAMFCSDVLPTDLRLIAILIYDLGPVI